MVHLHGSCSPGKVLLLLFNLKAQGCQELSPCFSFDFGFSLCKNKRNVGYVLMIMPLMVYYNAHYALWILRLGNMANCVHMIFF